MPEQREAPETLRVMLVDDQPARALQVQEALQKAGYAVVGHLPSASGLLQKMEAWQADLVIIDLQSPDRDILDSCSLISQFNPVPIVMFSALQEREFIEQAIQAGVSAYQVEGLDANRVRPILEVAIAQFRSHIALKKALQDTQQELQERKVIEQAKGLLMATQKISEDQAHSQLRQLSMDAGIRMPEAARQVITILQKPQRN